MTKIRTTFEITPDGNLQGLYTDHVDLFNIGKVTKVRKASNVEFNESKQTWEVSAIDGTVIHENKNREAAIEFEIEAFSPGGEYCHV